MGALFFYISLAFLFLGLIPKKNFPSPLNFSLSKPVTSRNLPSHDISAALDLLNLNLQELVLPGVTMQGVHIKALPISGDESSVGRLRELDVRCDVLRYRQQVFKKIHIQLFQPQVDLQRFLETQELQIFSVEKVRIVGIIPVECLRGPIERSLPWLQHPSINFVGSDILLVGNVAEVQVQIKVSVHIAEKTLMLRLVKIKVGFLSVPLAWVPLAPDQFFSLKANDDMPFDLDIKNITGKGDVFVIES